MPSWSYKTKLCTYFVQGRCLRGELCTFAHGRADYHFWAVHDLKPFSSVHQVVPDVEVLVLGPAWSLRDCVCESYSPSEGWEVSELNMMIDKFSGQPCRVECVDESDSTVLIRLETDATECFWLPYFVLAPMQADTKRSKEEEQDKTKEVDIDDAPDDDSPAGDARGKCLYAERCLEFVQSLPEVVQKFCNFDEHSLCYCQNCHDKRGDGLVYTRGGANYALPIGWFRLALKTGGLQAEAFDAWNWHVAFHGTRVQNLRPILGTSRLLKPGDPAAALGGKAVKIVPGHIQTPLERTNQHTGDRELLDPLQIFLSPSIRYVELPQYAQIKKWESSDTSSWTAQVAFQVRLKPDTYSIGQETVGATGQIDPNFRNESIEYYTKGDEHGSHVLTGLLVKLEKVEV